MDTHYLIRAQSSRRLVAAAFRGSYCDVGRLSWRPPLARRPISSCPLAPPVKGSRPPTARLTAALSRDRDSDRVADSDSVTVV